MEIFFDELYDLIKKSRKAKLVEVAEFLDINPTAHDKIGLQRAIRNALGEAYKNYEDDLKLNTSIYNILTRQ